MMNVVPIRWQSKSRIEHLRALVSTRSEEWLRQWGAASLLLEVAAATEGIPVDHSATDRWVRIAGVRGVLCVRATSTTMELLGCRLAGVVTPDAHGLAAGVGRRAFADLIKAIAGSSDSMRELPGPPNEDAFQPRSGVVGLLWVVEGIRIELYLDAELLEALSPQPRLPAADLVARSDAILPGELKLHAVLDLGKAALQDTLLLQPGEIIKTSVPLDAVVSVRSEAGDHVFSGMLVAAGGHRALSCTRNSRELGD